MKLSISGQGQHVIYVNVGVIAARICRHLAEFYSAER